MPYVHRDEEGKISVVSKNSFAHSSEWVEENTPELNEFLAAINSKKELFEKIDLSFVRVLEDVIDLLISKNIILLTELPSVAQRKIAERQHLRKSLQPHLDLLDDEGEESLF